MRITPMNTMSFKANIRPTQQDQEYEDNFYETASAATVLNATTTSFAPKALIVTIPSELLFYTTGKVNMYKDSKTQDPTEY